MKTEKLIYILDHREDYKCLFALNFHIYTDAKIKTFQSPVDLLGKVAEDRPKVIIINSQMFPENLDYGAKLSKILSPIDPKPKVLYLGDSAADKLAYFTCAPFDYKLQKVVRFMARALEVTAKKMAQMKVDEYFSLPLEFVLPGWPLMYDIFVQEKQTVSRVLESGDILTEDHIETFKKDGKEEIFVKSKERVKFVNSFTTAMVDRLKDTSLSFEEQSENLDQAFNLIRAQAKKSGISEGSMQVANAAIEGMHNLCEDVPLLDSLLEKLKKDTLSFRFRHSFLISFIGTHLIRKMPWSNVEHTKKMCFVAFFHDISLEEDDYTQFRSDKEVDDSSLSNFEKIQVKCHAQESAKIVSTIKGAPMGVDTIIKQHHGCKEGNSLSKLSISISPLAVVFVIAEEWSHVVIKKNEEGINYSKENVIEVISSRYNHQTYQKVIPYLNELEI